MSKFVCKVCGYIHEGDSAPARCPQCGVPADKFTKVEEKNRTWATEHVVGITEGVSEEKKSTPPKEQEVKNEPVSKTQSTEVPPVENAAALFLERHNERAKRTKRK